MTLSNQMSRYICKCIRIMFLPLCPKVGLQFDCLTVAFIVSMSKTVNTIQCLKSASLCKYAYLNKFSPVMNQIISNKEDQILLSDYSGLDARKSDFDVCEQQRRRSACACAQSDKLVCYSLSGKYSSQTCFKQNLFKKSSWSIWLSRLV